MCRGCVWTFNYAGGQAQNQREITNELNPDPVTDAGPKLTITGFGQDANGELYLASFNGSVCRIDAK